MTDDTTDAAAVADDRRERGKAKLRDVYGWDFEPTKPFEVATVDHLFGEVWDGGAFGGSSDLSVRDHRLVLLGLMAGAGLEDVAAIQVDSALRLGELSPDDLRHLVAFLAHYAGWPRAARLNTVVEEAIARHEPPADR